MMSRASCVGYGKLLESNLVLSLEQWNQHTTQALFRTVSNLTVFCSFTEKKIVLTLLPPTAVDWRDSGAVTDIRKQGDCGACWAITAVETAESAHYISTGNLYNLAESEIITCDETCEMCDGGWPQNAFEWIMDNGGLPLQSYFPYDGSTLYAMTQGIAGNSNTWT